ncbi:acetoin dehydrogenase operon transcriptional activator AcoR [Clostridium homopropionicum DSM 5847]|uniref:Acetoin dehydrogenase operon transcriptional activator AcoR n=1 Tax=Clostridium homopropionicum DSM 5847 TaxID=1121318 RepID=A0A0L6Z7C1_9CLOT|nr:sigma 54-interacting transcriptional regulator [Clostridium homopropionicum]KOA18688.1 acetoin dehydrogenase operon transcriptional activator AcoR [Clostridium homopropionicum DSM 5847]SFG52735.1 PAS domain S-box-containing protein [Clostridium homopropionicum]
MNKLVQLSHERCISKGIVQDNPFSSKIIEGEELKQVLDINKELIQIAAPFMNHLYDFVKGSGFFSLLCDSEGCILNSIGDENILSEAEKLKMIKGAYMDEIHIGTNAMSVAISEKVPVQISGEEHFISVYHKWTCCAAPIRDSFGSTIGIIDLTGYVGNVHKHTLGMVVAAANAIEKMLQINKYNKMLQLSNKRLETTFHSISSGILTCDMMGNIISMNKQVIRILGYSELDIRKMKIYDFIENWSDIESRIDDNVNVINEDTYIKGRWNKLQYTLTIYPIYDSSMKLHEITLLINELKFSRKIAGKILGGQAVYTFDEVIGKNKNLMQTIDYAKKIASSRSTVLITGESGTGKEVFAQAIHNYSNRKNEAFIALNCGAIPRTLIESELFGYEDGSFTGAKKGGNAGKFEIAEGGTIFLDEIGEMPIDMQTKLLRVIEEGKITRIGSSKTIPIDVRIIAATNKDLKKEIERGNFRKDLYYRLHVLPIYLPPLRERKDDIEELINYYMKKTSEKLNKKEIKLTEEHMRYLIEYDWPGNVRELENVVELMINSEEIRLEFSEKTIRIQETYDSFTPDLSLDAIEKQHIMRIINDSKGNLTLAAKVLNIGRNTLYRKMEKYHLDRSIIERSSEIERGLE